MQKKEQRLFEYKSKKRPQLMRRLWIFGMLGVLGLGLFSNVTVKAKDAEPVFPVVSDNWLTPAPVIETEDGKTTRAGAALPSRFDGREKGWVTPVKDQGDYNTCWAFSTMAALEGNLIKNGYADKSIDLSENQFAYFFYHRQTDNLGYTAGDYNQIVGIGKNYLSLGGNLTGASIALATWAGTTTEQKSPYLTTPANSLCYEADYSVKNVYLYTYNQKTLTNSVNTIKQAIMDHGAVACGIYFDLEYVNSENAAYYCPKSGGNHAVAIVGWDDSYSRNNFSSQSVKPTRDGAWIVKNSYGVMENAAALGKHYVDAGYNYVSYEDASLTEFVAFEAVPKSQQYDNNYQHDGTANPVYGYSHGEWYANVFTAKEAGKYNEELKAIGVYTLNTKTNYEVQVYTGLESASKPVSGTKVFSQTVKGTLTDAGYQTITLPKAVSLTAGERFAVMVKLTTPSGGNATIGVDTTANMSWINFKAKVGKNQSFVKADGKWYDFGAKRGANLRIKAYTDKTKKKSNFKLSSSLGISKGSTEKLAVKTDAKNVYRSVVWKSSNPQVVSVNSKGKIKGTAYGTATISATFVGSTKKKTLRCKVTVGPAKMKKFSVAGGKKLTVKWNRNTAADGYEIYYAAGKTAKYKKLADISKGRKTSYTRKLSSGTYSIKMRAYKKQGKTKLYGSFTKVKTVQIR
ncbi:MAG: lectin like domain-containing protein [Bacteroidales bacterium]|nr:lectin like domain-containing protein [Clostridium sp.]MCM1202999.1 lectin like domain-containing protein [Bacteroidales bacterium]